MSQVLSSHSLSSLYQQYIQKQQKQESSTNHATKRKESEVSTPSTKLTPLEENVISSAHKLFSSSMNHQYHHHTSQATLAPSSAKYYAYTGITSDWISHALFPCTYIDDVLVHAPTTSASDQEEEEQWNTPKDPTSETSPHSSKKRRTSATGNSIASTTTPTLQSRIIWMTDTSSLRSLTVPIADLHGAADIIPLDHPTEGRHVLVKQSINELLYNGVCYWFAVIENVEKSIESGEEDQVQVRFDSELKGTEKVPASSLFILNEDEDD